jgi:hypothetical protein
MRHVPLEYRRRLPSVADVKTYVRAPGWIMAYLSGTNWQGPATVGTFWPARQSPDPRVTISSAASFRSGAAVCLGRLARPLGLVRTVI